MKVFTYLRTSQNKPEIVTVIQSITRFCQLAVVGRPMACLCQLAPAEALLPSLALLLALLVNLVSFIMKEFYGWSLEMVTQHQY